MAQNVGTKSSEMVEATGQSAIKDDRPGETKLPNHGLFFEGLGSLDEFPDPVDVKSEEGTGTPCVVLSDILTGAGGEIYTKGQIQRLSKLVSGYDGKDRDAVKSQVKRFVALGAIRHATPEEIAQGFAEVTAETESESTQAERARRLLLEDENAKLRQQIAELNGGTVPKADPFEEG